MSYALYNEIKSMRQQILDLLVRVESLEEYRAEQRKKREIITLKKPAGELQPQGVQHAIQK
jgi:hypothetical protein